MHRSVAWVRELPIVEFNGWIAYYGMAQERREKAAKRTSNSKPARGRRR